jgi:hypothetical protein
MSKVLICGSRDVEIYLQDINKVFDDNNIIPEFIISGGATGPDRTAIDWAKHNQVDYIVYYPDWDKYGNRAGLIRNIAMVDECDVCIAFWNGRSRGTRFTIDETIRQNKKVIIVEKGTHADD